MFDIIPLQYYTAIYYHVMFVIALFIVLQSVKYDIIGRAAIDRTKIIGSFLLIGLVLYMGLRPISGMYFGDMGTYAMYFDRLASGDIYQITNDYAFNYFMLFCTKFMNVNMFFLLTAFLYILPCYIFSRKYFGRYWFFAFFMFVGSFSFWAYGTNGIRNGLATSMFLLALTFYDRKLLMYALMVLAFGIHYSVVIPIAAFIAALIIKNPKVYLFVWLAAIPLSLVGGGFFQSFFGQLFTADERAINYLTKGNVNDDVFSSTGFRWDFLFYSASAVFAGYYYIFKKKIVDKFYIVLFGTYVFANAFWILVIRANFSNRFAYLSWFMMAAVIAYPMFKYKLWKVQYKTAAFIMFAYFGFSYIMFLLS